MGNETISANAKIARTSFIQNVTHAFWPIIYLSNSPIARANCVLGAFFSAPENKTNPAIYNNLFYLCMINFNTHWSCH